MPGAWLISVLSVSVHACALCVCCHLRHTRGKSLQTSAPSSPTAQLRGASSRGCTPSPPPPPPVDFSRTTGEKALRRLFTPRPSSSLAPAGLPPSVAAFRLAGPGLAASGLLPSGRQIPQSTKETLSRCPLHFGVPCLTLFPRSQPGNALPAHKNTKISRQIVWRLQRFKNHWILDGDAARVQYPWEETLFGAHFSFFESPVVPWFVYEFYTRS